MFCRQCGAQLTDNATFCMQCGAKVNDAPQQTMQETPDTYQMPYEPMYNPEETPPKKPINKKKLAISLVSILLCLSLVAGLFVYFTYSATAERAVREATEDSAELLENLLTEDTGLERLLEAIDDLDGEFTLSISSGTDSASLAFSNRKEIISLLCNIEGVSFQVAADNDKLVISSPDGLDKAYSIPLANFGKAFVNSPLGASAIAAEMQGVLQGISFRLFDFPSLEAFEHTEFYQEYKESIEVEEVDASIPHSKGVETVYRMNMDAASYQRYSKKCINYMLGPVLGEDLVSLLTYSMFATPTMAMTAPHETLYGLDEDGRLVASHVTMESSGETFSFTLALTGERNPWEKIELYSDNELIGTISIQKENGVISVYVDGGRFLMIDDQRLILGHEEDPLTIYYEVRNGGCYFTLEIDGQTAEIELLPTCTAEMPKGDIVDIFSLTMEELEALLAPVSSMLY